MIDLCSGPFSKISDLLPLAPSILKEADIPRKSDHIMPQDIGCPIISDNFEIAVIRTHPAIQNFLNLNQMIVNPKPPGRLFAPVAWVTFDLYIHGLHQTAPSVRPGPAQTIR